MINTLYINTIKSLHIGSNVNPYDKTQLILAKAAAALLDETNYTSLTWGVLVSALALPETTQQEVNNKTLAINNAIAALRDVRFIITVDTTKAGSSNNQFVLPVTAISGNYIVDWGEGVEETFTTIGDKTHTYAAQGTYKVSVKGGLTAISFNDSGDKLKPIYIDAWGTIKWSTFAYMFFGCLNIMGRYIDSPDSSNAVTTMRMFRGCSKFNSNLNNFNTENINNMSFMFFGCTMFNQSLSNFNTSKVNNMSNMLRDAIAFKQSLATFDITSVTKISEFMQNGDINSIGTTTNYDAILISWAAQDVNIELYPNFGRSKYSSTAVAARKLLTDPVVDGGKGWTITDGGLAV